jgi:hypothetical protein
MFSKSETEGIINDLNKAIVACLEVDISQIAGECIQYRVEEDVYPLYTPTQYERRKRNGGIADPFMYSYNVDPSTQTLRVSDNRREVGVVESGVGYQWTESAIYAMQPYPRPYFNKAEQDIIADGEAEAALIRAISKL